MQAAPAPVAATSSLNQHAENNIANDTTAPATATNTGAAPCAGTAAVAGTGAATGTDGATDTATGTNTDTVVLSESAEKLAHNPAPPRIGAMRHETIFEYDTTKFPLTEAMAELLEAEGEDAVEQLAKTHLREISTEPPLNPRVMHAYRFSGKQIPTRWKRSLMKEKQLITKVSVSL